MLNSEESNGSSEGTKSATREIVKQAEIKLTTEQTSLSLSSQHVLIFYFLFPLQEILNFRFSASVCD